MIEAQKAAFSFESFKIPKFSYEESNHLNSDIKIGFLPSGKLNINSGEFELTLKFITHVVDNPEQKIFDLTSVAVFKFDSKISKDEIPEFFYRNAIAIIFPYLRSFISTLTLQANTKLLKLGLMNLSDLEEPLRRNTSEVE